MEKELVLLVLAPLCGKLAQWLVDRLKIVRVFADSRPVVKQVVAFLVSTAVAYGGFYGLTFAGGADPSVGDVTKALVAIASYAFSMVFYNSKKLSGGT